MRFQGLRGPTSRWPPNKTPLGQSLLRQPESLAVIRQNSDRRPAPAAEDKYAAGERICGQLLLAQPRQRIDALSSVYGLDRDQDAHLRRELNHRVGSQNTRLSPLRSGAVVPFHWMRILPRGPSNSIRHSDRPTGGAISSRNAGGAVVRGTGGEDCASFLSL